MGRLGGVRILCLQQVALDLLRLRGLPDRLPEGALPFGVHGGAAEPKPGGHQAADALHERVQAHGHPGAGARHQRVDAHLLVEQVRRRAFRAGGREGRRRSRRGEHHRRTQCQRPLQGYIRPDGTGEFHGREPQMLREPGLCRRVRFDIGLPPGQVLRSGCT